MTVGGREGDSNVELLVPVMTNELSRKEETVMLTGI